MLILPGSGSWQMRLFRSRPRSAFISSVPRSRKSGPKAGAALYLMDIEARKNTSSCESKVVTWDGTQLLNPNGRNCLFHAHLQGPPPTPPTDGSPAEPQPQRLQAGKPSVRRLPAGSSGCFDWGASPRDDMVWPSCKMTSSLADTSRPGLFPARDATDCSIVAERAKESWLPGTRPSPGRSCHLVAPPRDEVNTQ